MMKAETLHGNMELMLNSKKPRTALYIEKAHYVSHIDAFAELST